MRNTLEKALLFCLLIGSISPLLIEGTPEGEFHESPKDVAAPAGDDVTLTCRIKFTHGNQLVNWTVQQSGGQNSIIGIKQWPNKGEIFPSFPRCSWGKDPANEYANGYRIYDLHIKNITAHDSGNYACVHSEKHRSAHLQVLPPRVAETTVNHLGTKRLVCHIAGVKSAWWTISKKDGHYKLKSRQISVRGSPTAYSSRVTYDWAGSLADGSNYDIIISNARTSDRGVYRCVTSPNQTKVESRLRVLADDDPVFDRRPHDTYAIQLSHVTLRCGVRARKGGNVIAQWKKSNDSRRQNPTVFPFKHNDTELHAGFEWASRSPGNFDLTFFSVNKSHHEGYYWCEALPKSNDPFNEVISAGATLRVFSKPSGSNGLFIPTSTIRNGSAWLRHWIHVPCIPRKNVIWLDEDLNVLTDGTESHSEDPRFEVSSILTGGLYIKGVQIKDAQKFYCVLAGDSFVWELSEHLIVQGCPAYWVYNDSLDLCFGSPKSALSFGDAERWCRQFNAHLTMPKNTTYTKVLLDMSGWIWYYRRKLWIGLDDIEWENQWKWADGRLLTGNDHYWSANEPDNGGGDSNCGLMDEDREFRDDQCWKKHDFICQRTAVYWSRLAVRWKDRCPKGWTLFDCGELCYWMSDEKMTWADVRDACEKKYSIIATMRSKRQWRSVQLMLKLGPSFQHQDIWIGLRKFESQYEWSDGTLEPWPWSSINWGTRHSSGNCLCMDLKGRVNAQDCSAKKYVVCQKSQDVLRIDGWAISECGKIEGSNKPAYIPKPSKRDVGHPADSKGNKTNGLLSIAAIFNGDEIAIEDAPWAVRIVAGGQVVCSGVLIGPKTVLTSGHCVLHKRNRPMSSHEVFVGLGSEDRTHSGRLEPVHAIQVHKDFAVDQFDIAVIELKREQIADCWNVKTACLPESKNADFTNFTCKLLSWGAYGALQGCDLDYNSVRLRESTGVLYYSKTSYCKLAKWDFGAPYLCIEDNNTDSNWTLVGIYSENFGRYEEFTYVPHYLTWIHEKIQERVLPWDKVYQEIACYQSRVDIACDHGRPPLIQVTRATYGTQNIHRCSYQRPKRLGCARDVTETVKKRCAGKNRCQFNVTTELFGNPCRHYEYLEMTYQCVNPYGYHSGMYGLSCIHGNDSEPLELSCGVGNPLQIVVLDAEYRSGPPGECPSWRGMNPSCRHNKKDVTKEIEDRCNGKVFCWDKITVKPSWGDPCPGYEKHVIVSYICVKNATAYFGHAHADGATLQPSSTILMVVISTLLLMIV